MTKKIVTPTSSRPVKRAYQYWFPLAELARSVTRTAMAPTARSPSSGWLRQPRDRVAWPVPTDWLVAAGAVASEGVTGATLVAAEDAH